MDHLERNRDKFEPYMEDDEPFGVYLGRMRGDAEWGGNQELVAASQLYKVHCGGKPKPERFLRPMCSGRRHDGCGLIKHVTRAFIEGCQIFPKKFCVTKESSHGGRSAAYSKNFLNS